MKQTLFLTFYALLLPLSLIASDPLESRIDRQDKRYNTFAMTMKMLTNRKAKVLVETGTARFGDQNFAGDGGSTILFADWAFQNNALLYSVDIDENCLEVASKATRAYEANVIFTHSDSIEFLENFPEMIDFLYLDSMDFNKKKPKRSQKHHLREIESVYDKLSPQCIVLIDDCNYSQDGKGKYVIRFLKKKGWRVVANSYQVIMVR